MSSLRSSRWRDCASDAERRQLEREKKEGSVRKNLNKRESERIKRGEPFESERIVVAS